ncbi:MAG: regulator of sigma protease, partial [Thermoleophilaceae bacterium]|nr:regulator of sigma protease [Thermoleophilaceae bacterium]
MSWFLAALGFIVLIVLHEAGHFLAAKAVGMRVERFSLFFPPLLFKKKIGETEYAIGAVPLGGYVKISGMNPSEELPDEVRTRAYYSQPVWKRVTVIFAGPAVNLVVGFVLLVVYVWLIGVPKGNEVGDVAKGFPAQAVLHPGDQVVSIDGKRGSVEAFSKQIATHRCEVQPPTDHCRATTPAKVTIVRGGREQTISITPVFDAKTKPAKMRLGFSYNPNGGPHVPEPFGPAVGQAASGFWRITTETVKIPAKILDSKQRKQINGIVGSYETTRQTILHDPSDVVYILAVISLALALVNLFPFLPLDGGHIFWALVEKIRRKPVSFALMERSGLVGFALVLMLFVIGL